MSAINFFKNPLRSTVLSAVEATFNNADSTAVFTLLKFTGNDEKTFRLITKLKRAVTRLKVDISDEDGAIKIEADVTGAGTVFISVFIGKTKTEEGLEYTVKSVATSAEWLTIIADEIILGELLEEKDKKINVTGFPGILLDFLI